MIATTEGRTYDIPDLWVAGYCKHGATVDGAVFYWHRQVLMEEESNSAQASAGSQVDYILRTSLQKVTPNTTKVYGAERSKMVRDLFRSLGWSKFFRVTKGGYSLGTSIEWADGARPQWVCDAQQARKDEAIKANYYISVPMCCCGTCKRREAQRSAVARRVHAALNAAFSTGREFGDRSDISTDYSDADYTFHA